VTLIIIDGERMEQMTGFTGDAGRNHRIEAARKQDDGGFRAPIHATALIRSSAARKFHLGKKIGPPLRAAQSAFQPAREKAAEYGT